MTALNVTGSAVVSGDLRLGGTFSPAIARSNILALEELKTFPIPLTAFRVHNAMQTLLPGTPLTPDLGLVGGTFGAATPSLRTEDLKTAGATSNYARVLLQLPWEYIAAQTINLRFKAGMITTASDGTATLACEAYKLQGDPDDDIGSDLVVEAATNMNSMVFANVDFTVTSTGLSPGDILDVRITTAINDGASLTAVIGGITSAQLLCDVK